jgi:hypothetical protein
VGGLEVGQAAGAGLEMRPNLRGVGGTELPPSEPSEHLVGGTPRAQSESSLHFSQGSTLPPAAQEITRILAG